MRNKLIEIITDSDDKLNKRRITESYFQKNYPNIFIDINELIKEDISFSGKIYMIYNGITEVPKCLSCNNLVKFQKFSLGFYKYCSKSCVGLSPDVVKKKEETMLKNYGVKYTLQSKEIVKRIKETNLIKYGNKIPQRTDIIKDRVIQTTIKKYGTTHTSKTIENKEKRAETNLIKYGVENCNQVCESKQKSRTTNLLRYGDEVPMRNKRVKAKHAKTVLKKYNTTCSMNSSVIKEKIKKNNLIKYGVEIPSQNETVKSKIKESLCKTLNNKSVKYWTNKFLLKDGNVTIENNNITIRNYCDIHESFTIESALLSNRSMHGINNFCTICNPISENVSIKENEIKDFIQNELKIMTIKHKINHSEIDVFIPTYNIGIEFNGLYWHSDKYKDWDYHLNKTKLCEENNINLLHIFEDEWINKKEIVKSIIKLKLNIYESIIFIDDTTISIPTVDEIKIFVENNSIIDSEISEIRFGLYFNGELVEILQLENKIDCEYEIITTCSKINTQIFGGFDKLLKHFISIYNPTSIILSLDRRYFDNKIYKNLGFSFLNNINPRFFYCKSGKPIRYCQTDIDLIDKNQQKKNKNLEKFTIVG